MSVLSQSEIEEAMDRPADKDPLILTPMLDRKQQVGGASVDLRLGGEFIVLRRSSVDRVDPTQRDFWERNLHRTQERVRISLHREFIIHPGQLVLGGTVEYLSLPRTLFASIEARSSWGRLGLIIAMASSIAPGFQGSVTLELVNDGEVPLALYPGVRIAQLILHHTKGVAAYHGKYDCPTGPQFSRLQNDSDIAGWGRRKASE